MPHDRLSPETAQRMIDDAQQHRNMLIAIGIIIAIVGVAVYTTWG